MIGFHMFVVEDYVLSHQSRSQALSSGFSAVSKAGKQSWEQTC